MLQVKNNSFGVSSHILENKHSFYYFYNILLFVTIGAREEKTLIVKLYFLFSAPELAQEVQMSVCLSVLEFQRKFFNILGSSWVILKSSLGHLWLSWDHPGSSLVHPIKKGCKMSRKRKNNYFTVMPLDFISFLGDMA